LLANMFIEGGIFIINDSTQEVFPKEKFTNAVIPLKKKG